MHFSGVALGLILALKLTPDTGEVSAARKAVAINLSTGQGREYDAAVGTHFSKHYASTLARCISGQPESELRAFELFVRVQKDGRFEHILSEPHTAVSSCVARSVQNASFPKPPSGRYWVRIQVSLAP